MPESWRTRPVFLSSTFRDMQAGRSRPFLIVLLGERYGWIPPAERMAAATRSIGGATAG